MSLWKRLWPYRTPEADLDAELRFHVQRQLDDRPEGRTVTR